MSRYSEIEEFIFSILPVWNCQIVKPFKQILPENCTLEMYTCLSILQNLGGTAAISQLAFWTQTSKQQMSVLVQKLERKKLVSREFDSVDRRMVLVQITDRGLDYLDNVPSRKTNFFRLFFSQMNEAEKRSFYHGLQSISQVFLRVFDKIRLMAEDDFDDPENTGIVFRLQEDDELEEEDSFEDFGGFDSSGLFQENENGFHDFEYESDDPSDDFEDMEEIDKLNEEDAIIEIDLDKLKGVDGLEYLKSLDLGFLQDEEGDFPF